jgi:hypothetical protein
MNHIFTTHHFKSADLLIDRNILRLLRIPLCLVLVAVFTGSAGVTYADQLHYCESVAANAEAFTEERKKGFTKNQVKENARLIAQQRELDQGTLAAWYAEIEWVFNTPQKRYGPVASRQRRLEDCLANGGK